MSNTSIGNINRNNQIVIRKLGRSQNHQFATAYKLLCLDCDETHIANSCDLHLRLCPHCQGGK